MVTKSNEIRLLAITQSAEAVASNDDLLTEILLRLPIRSVLHFKSVSKHWLSVITNPIFSILRNLNPLPPLGLFLQSSSTFYTPEYEYISFKNDSPSNIISLPSCSRLPIPGNFVAQILQSCNGLLCCRSFEWCEPDERYHIYNPTTKKFTTLPPLDGSKPPNIFCMILAFDPSNSLHYKVICVLDAWSDYTRYRIEIYSSETRSWRVASQPFTTTESPDTNFLGGVYWNGAIHWMRGSWSSLLFRIHEEKLETIPVPHLTDRWDEPFGPSYFGESNGHLHIIHTCGPRTTQLNVYELVRDYSRWYVKYHLDLDELPVVFPEMVRKSLEPTDRNYYTFSLLSFVRGERDEDSFMVLELPCKVIKYNILNGTSKKLSDVAQNLLGNDEFGLRYKGTSFQYIESLSSV